MPITDDDPFGGRREVTAERRVYTARATPTTESAILTYGFSQVYIALGDQTEEGSRVVRIWHKSFVLLIWGGMLLMSGAGLLSLTDRRLRIGAPRPSRSSKAPVEASK